MLALHHDLGPGDRFFWFSTTGWMMWNYLASAPAVGAGIVMFDGDPAHPGLDALWKLAEEAGDHLLRHVGAVPAGLPQGRREAAKANLRSSAASAPPARRCRPRASSGSTRT